MEIVQNLGFGCIFLRLCFIGAPFCKKRLCCSADLLPAPLSHVINHKNFLQLMRNFVDIIWGKCPMCKIKGLDISFLDFILKEPKFAKNSCVPEAKPKERVMPRRQGPRKG